MAALARCFFLAILWTGVAVAQERFFDSGGVRIRYVERGAGVAVVLVIVLLLALL
jgi:hypothetical protein